MSRLGEGTTPLAHVINVHTSAGFSAVELFNSLFENSSSNFDLFFTKDHCLFLLLGSFITMCCYFIFLFFFGFYRFFCLMPTGPLHIKKNL